jgi:hypothetical protein
VPTAEEATLDGSVLEVDLVTPDGACTRDLVPRVSVVAVPEGVDPAEDLEINATVDGVEGNVTLAGVSGLAGPGTETDFVPSAGWTGVTGTFVLVTWGSSTCPRIVESAEATGPAEVTVTFVVPPADQVCTMDMVPHGDVLVVDGLEGASDVALVLEAGPDAEPVSLKIYGEN